MLTKSLHIGEPINGTNEIFNYFLHIVFCIVIELWKSNFHVCIKLKNDNNNDDDENVDL